MSQTVPTDEVHITDNARSGVIKRFSPQLPEMLDDPYAVNAYYREHDPAHWEVSTYSWLPGMWYLFRHRDNARALKMTAEHPPSLGGGSGQGRTEGRAVVTRAQPKNATQPWLRSSRCGAGTFAINPASRKR